MDTERPMKNWWHLSAAEAAAALGTDPRSGLPAAEAAARLESSGPNELREAKGRGPLAIFLEQFEGLIIWVLIVAAVVSGFLGEWLDALAILAIVLLNAVLGLVQEYRAEKSLAALRKMSAPFGQGRPRRRRGPRPGPRARARRPRSSSRPATASRPTAASSGTRPTSPSRRRA